MWTTEPVPGVSGRRWWAIPPTEVGVTVAKRLLSGPPDSAALLAARDAVLAARAAEEQTKIENLEVDARVSTGVSTDEREVATDG